MKMREKKYACTTSSHSNLERVGQGGRRRETGERMVNGYEGTREGAETGETFMEWSLY